MPRSGSQIKAIVKKILSGRLLNHVRACRRLGPRARSIYWRLQLLRPLKAERKLPCGETAAVRSVLFVCWGNIIRSPMAAALLEKYLSELGRNDISVSSAGLRAKPGRGADGRALMVARQFGVSLEGHRARALEREMVEQADAIFVMDSLNEAGVLGRFPQAASKVFLLGVYAGGESQPTEIMDPYDGDGADIHRCYEVIQSSVRRLILDLSSGRSEQEPNALQEAPLAGTAGRR